MKVIGGAGAPAGAAERHGRAGEGARAPAVFGGTFWAIPASPVLAAHDGLSAPASLRNDADRVVRERGRRSDLLRCPLQRGHPGEKLLDQRLL